MLLTFAGSPYSPTATRDVRSIMLVRGIVTRMRERASGGSSGGASGARAGTTGPGIVAFGQATTEVAILSHIGALEVEHAVEEGGR